MERRAGAERGPALVTGEMTSVIDRTLAAYSLVAILNVVPVAVALWPATRLWWLVVFGGGLVASAVCMNLLALRRRSIRPAAAVYALLVPVGYLAQHWGIQQNAVSAPGVLSGAVGVGVVCAGVWRGGRFAVGYAVVTAALLVAARTGARGGTADLALAVCEGVFSVGAGLSILAVALGMSAAAAAADALDARVRRREVDLAVEQAVAAERARLDQMIHDDVLTALAAASRAHGPQSVAAVAALAGTTRRTIDLPRPAPGEQERIPLGVLRRLLTRTSARISPRIVVTDAFDRLDDTARVPVAAAEVGLRAVQEALRNAVRHADAGRIELEVGAGPVPEQVRVRVRDDGRGFATGSPSADRLGVRVSLGEALDRAGLQHRLTSELGVGTEFELVWTGERGQRDVPVERLSPGPTGPALPAEFPVRRLTSVAWAVTVGTVAIGLVLLSRVAEPLSVVGMVLVGLLMAVLLHTGPLLVLPARSATAALVLVLGLVATMSLAVPATGDPSVAAWHQFPLQLALVVLVLRRRLVVAVAALTAAVAANLVWWSRGDLPVPLALTMNFGVVTFFVMALLVSRMLARIARRQQELRDLERAVVDDAVRSSTATLQGALWASDLRSRARDVLGRLAALVGDPDPGLVTEALMLEATLREEIVARNVMNEELASLTDAARRRGVDVRIVDSRTSQASLELARAVNAEVRATLASRGLARLVVRWAPDPADRAGGADGGLAPAASVVAQVGSDVTLTVLGDTGEREERRAGS